MCNVGGWFDIFAQGTIDNFVGLQNKGVGLAAGNQKLIMGARQLAKMLDQVVVPLVLIPTDRLCSRASIDVDGCGNFVAAIRFDLKRQRHERRCMEILEVDRPRLL